MQIIIPMSGFGERFRRAGYTVPKPLIEVDGKPIIGHVLDLFPGETDVVFICNRDHLAEFALAETLAALCPTGRIAAIEPHRLGPVHAVRQAAAFIRDNEPVVVNYCDFTCYWDWADFRAFVAESGCDGAIPAYRGFHPHSLGSTFYAYCRQQGLWLQDIQEKQPYTATPMAEFASSGTYYFASGALMKQAFQATVEQGLAVGGEFYVSLAYKPLLAAGRAVAIYELQHFMQWGTPEDLRDYQGWSRTFRRLAEQPRRRPLQHGTVLMPMAGLGSRFAAAGYDTPKPLIPVDGKPMALRAAEDLPEPDAYVFVLRRMPGCDALADSLRQGFPGCRVTLLDEPTEGQAATCLAALDQAGPGPLTIAACDNGAIYDADRFARLMAEGCDVVVWVARGYAGALRNPTAYGWVDTDAAGRIRGVSVKAPLADPAHDPVVIGTFTFRDAALFEACARRMMEREARVNGEFYVDTCINDAVALGLDCRILEVDAYLNWGTPDDLASYRYWQSCFHKWPSHPYRLEHDGRVAADAVPALAADYTAFRPARPGGRR